MGKSIKAANALLEEMTSNNYHWSSKRAAPKRANGIYGIDAVDLLASKVAQCLDRLGTPPPGSLVGGSSGTMFEVGAICEICGIQGHVAAECQSTFLGIEHANAMQNYGQCPQNNPFSNTYNSSWRNHPNFSYRNNNPMPPILPNHNPPFSNTRHPTPHLHNNNHPGQNPTWRVLWSAS